MEPRKISAEIIADSINADGTRLTTFVLTFPRIVLAEFNTHRVFSRNSASSRAIPFKKMLKMVEEDPFVPIAFQKDHKGMQGTEYLEGEAAIKAKEEWLFCAQEAVLNTTYFHEVTGVTKQLCNRMLEPFAWHTVIVTASDYENFFALRAHEAAEIHIQKLAHVMLDAYNESSPCILSEGQWHIPFGEKLDRVKMMWEVIEPNVTYTRLNEEQQRLCEKTAIKIATARCARVSYMNFDGKDDYAQDVALHDRLSQMGHWSPFEHCAQANDCLLTPTSGNFGRGWLQYRKTFENENKTDPRVK